MNPRSLYRKFSDLLGRTPFHPQFFSKRFLEQQVKNRASGFYGIVVDLGCGFGPYKKYFRQAHYSGLDYKPSNMIKDTKDLDISGDLTCLPFASSGLDGVLCTQVLEHVTDPVKAVAEIKRALKPGGKLLLSVPFFYPLHDEPHDYFRFTSHGLKKLLLDAGFEITEITPQGGWVEMAGELFNLFGIHKLEKLIGSGMAGGVLAVFLAPIFLVLALFTNLACLMISPLDRDRRFVMNYFVFARRK